MVLFKIHNVPQAETEIYYAVRETAEKRLKQLRAEGHKKAILTGYTMHRPQGVALLKKHQVIKRTPGDRNFYRMPRKWGNYGGQVICHLDKFMLEKGWSINDLAKITDLSTCTISKVKHDKHHAMNFVTISRILYALEIGFGDLFEFIPNPYPEKLPF